MTITIIRFDPKPEELRRLHIGPLSLHVEGFAALVCQLGYCRDNGWQKMRLMADLSRWLELKQIRLRLLEEARPDSFLQARWKCVSKQSGDQIAIRTLLNWYRVGADVETHLPEPAAGAVAQRVLFITSHSRHEQLSW